MTHTPDSIVKQFPAGTPVRVIQEIRKREGVYHAEVVGIVDAWESRPTGSWYAHGKQDRYWLQRLRLKKADGEITWLVLDDATRIARIELATA